MRASSVELCVLNVDLQIPKGAFGYMEQDAAIRELVKVTGKDYGDDVGAWVRYLRSDGWSLSQLMQNERYRRLDGET